VVKHEGSLEYSKQFLQTRHAVEGLRNSRDFIQLPSCLDEAMSTPKKVLYCLNTMRCFQNTVALSEARSWVLRMIVKLAYGDFGPCLHETSVDHW